MDRKGMKRWENKIAVVTGASYGIGFQLVQDLLLNGLQVIGLARDEEESIENISILLPQNLHSKLTAIHCDVTDVESVNEAFDEIIEKFGDIDILVNCAGCIKFGQLWEMKIEDIQQVLRTNFMGVIYCSRRAYKSMAYRMNCSHIIVINSTTGHQVMDPYGGTITDSNIYSPSKFALTAAMDTLRNEFAEMETRIKITSISPGFVNSGMFPYLKKEPNLDAMLKSEHISSAVLYAISTPENVEIKEMIIKPRGEKF